MLGKINSSVIQMSMLLGLLLALPSSAKEACAGNETCGQHVWSGQSHDESSMLQLQVNVDLNPRGHMKKGVVRLESTHQENDTMGNESSAKTAFGAPSLNESGDLGVLIAGLKVNIIMILVSFGFFMIAVIYYPNVFAFRATGALFQEKTAPITWPADDKDWFRWVKVSYATTVEMTIETCGLDSAMLIQFTCMAMDILAGVGLPNLAILSSLYCFCGYNAAGEDHLSYLGINNVNMKKANWIYWVVAVMSWYNVIFIQFRLFQWQRYFIKFRNEWLETMPQPRDSTVLVEGIDDEICSDAELKKFMEMLYGAGEILEAFVVKKIPELTALIEEYKAADKNLQEVEYFIGKNPDKPRPTFKVDGGDEQVYYSIEKKRLAEAIKIEQARVLNESDRKPEDTDIYAMNGFVTFKQSSTCVQALMTQVRADSGSFVFSVPPDPSDIIYHDLAMPRAKQEFLQLIGYGLVASLAAFYLPIISGISAISSPAALGQIRIVAALFEAVPAIEEFFASLAPSLGLSVMVSMLPTFLMRIFQSFFYLKANRWAQLQLQVYYYWFQVVFVLLIVAIGSSVIKTAAELAQSPFLIFSILADKMPLTTHFYMNYVVLQWATHATNMMRLPHFIKYLLFVRFYDPERARQISEPEDQNYYGLGSRSARFSLFLTMGIVFGTICPLIAVFCFFNFAFCRLIYGYLIPYAETRKGDLGGEHWALQLHQCHYGVFIYIILMVGILSQRADSIVPVLISASTFLWWSMSFYKFQTKLCWKTLALEEVVKSGKKNKRKPTRLTYQQPELEPDILKNIGS